MPSFSKSSARKLATCDERLQDIFNEVIKHFDCKILDGYRSKEKQDEAHRTGKSKARYPQSKHNKMPSLAADVAPYPVDWDDLYRFHEFAGFVQAIAITKGYKIKWGGKFKNFFDGPHYQIED
jgi:hypothetical protein